MALVNGAPRAIRSTRVFLGESYDSTGDFLRNTHTIPLRGGTVLTAPRNPTLHPQGSFVNTPVGSCFYAGTTMAAACLLVYLGRKVSRFRV